MRKHYTLKDRQIHFMKNVTTKYIPRSHRRAPGIPPFRGLCPTKTQRSGARSGRQKSITFKAFLTLHSLLRKSHLEQLQASAQAQDWPQSSTSTTALPPLMSSPRFLPSLPLGPISLPPLQFVPLLPPQIPQLPSSPPPSPVLSRAPATSSQALPAVGSSSQPIQNINISYEYNHTRSLYASRMALEQAGVLRVPVTEEENL